MQARRESHDIFKVLKGKKKNLQPRIHYQAKLSFKFEGKIKSFLEKQKIMEFINTKPIVQGMLKNLLHVKKK